MSRIGKKPIELTDKVEAKIEGDLITIKGPKGTLTQKIHPAVTATIDNGQILVTVKNPESGDEKALWGLFRSLINNMVVGVTSGFEKKLEINGVGYKARVEGSNKLILNVGYSHPVDFELPAGISCSVEANVITISGIDKQVVGEIAANIRKVRKPEPYKGKGIKYIDEVLRRKSGKTAAKSE